MLWGTDSALVACPVAQRNEQEAAPDGMARCSAPASLPTAQSHMRTAARLLDRGLELLPTGLRPHYTIRLRQADNAELGELLAALGPPVANLQYAKSTIWREEGP